MIKFTIVRKKESAKYDQIRQWEQFSDIFAMFKNLGKLFQNSRQNLGFNQTERGGGTLGDGLDFQCGSSSMIAKNKN